MLHTKSLAIIILIAIAAISLSIVSYKYYDSTSSKISNLAKQDIHNNAVIEANAISESLSTKIADIAGNLEVLAYAPTVQGDDVRSQKLFDSFQATTSDLTDGYYWIDKNGKIVTYSEINTGKFPDYQGNDLSFREYYKIPKQTLKPFVSTVIDSRDGVPRLYLSDPIIHPNGDFGGVVVASISTKNAGDFVHRQLLPEFRSMVALMDHEGLILYADNKTLIGTHYYDDAFQSILPAQVKTQFDSFLDRSRVDPSGIADISYGPNTVTIASKEVLINGEHSWTAYIVYPHILSEETESLLNQQGIFNIVIIVAIGIAAILTAAMVLTWNRRLELEVEKKTVELKHAADSLSQANEQLKEHEKMQTEFINIAAHELRTPIQPILSTVDVLRYRIVGKPETNITDNQVASLTRNAKRLQKLSAEILDATRIESGMLKLDKELIDVNEKVRNAVADAESLIPKGQGTKIQFLPLADESGEPIRLSVMADNLRMFEVVSNLIRNAIKFSAEGTITVTMGKIDDFVIVSVKDPGSGISEEMLPKLFTKFGADKERGGTGLGLFIAKNIVEAHGGRIWAENNSKDSERGATFTFTLPLADKATM